MYLHLGENIIVPLKQIIGIFDIQCCKIHLVQNLLKRSKLKLVK